MNRRVSGGRSFCSSRARRGGVLHSLALPRKLRDFPLTSRYLIGVSGGRDSVALLHWLVETGYRDLIVCHFNHQLLGRAATTDAKFVEDLAKAYRLEFECGKINVRALGVKKKIS